MSYTLVQRRWASCIALVLCLALLGGCSTVKSKFAGFFGGEESKKTHAPAELIPIKKTAVDIERVWRNGVGSGTGKTYLHLKPVIDGDTVYVADRKGRVSAVKAESGRDLWEHKTKQPISGGPGIGSGLVVVGTSDGDVIALGDKDGHEVWRGKVTSEVLATPRIGEGVVVIRTVDGKLIGLDARDGKQVWRYDGMVPVLSLRGTGAPAIAKGLAIGGMDNGKLVAVDIKTGKVAWETSVTTAHGRTDLERMVDIDGDLLVVNDTLYLATYHGRLAAVAVDSGEVRWTHDLSCYAGIAIEGERIYATDDQSHVLAFDRANGNVIWKNEQLDARSVTAPGVAGNAIVVGDFQGYLHWLNKSDGTYQGRGRIDKSPVYAAPLAAQNLVLAYSSQGYLAAFKQ